MPRTQECALMTLSLQVRVKSPVEPRDLWREAITAAAPAAAAVELDILISVTIGSWWKVASWLI